MNDVTAGGAPASFDLVDEVDVAGLKVAVVRAALELDLFEQLRQAPRSDPDLADAVGATADGLRVLVRALLSLELLERDGGGLLHNTAAAQAFLATGSPSSFAPILLSWFRNRDQLADVIRGRVSAKDHADDGAATLWRAYAAPDLVRWPASEPEVWARLSERGVAVPTGGQVLDLGCGSGLLSLTVVRRAEGARVVAVDRPEVLDVARQVAAEMGLTERLELRPGDVRTVDIETERYDVILLTNVAQYLDSGDLLATFRRIRAGLTPDGVFHLVTPRVDEGLAGSAVNWTTAVEMYLSSPLVPLRDAAALEGALREAGFTSLEQWPPNAYVCRR
jgi:2-polyprenyl-3-methyl-5-hydroxy-6-metoxy-1,4-benzoquinol methylase